MLDNSSELIFNKDGSLYHLNLKAGDVSHTIITVGDPERVPIVSAHFDKITLKKGKREFLTHTGTLSGKEISVISTGIGTDNVDIVLNELHALTKLQGVDHHSMKLIRLGTSGAVRESIPVNSILISEAAIGFDSLMHFYPWQNYTEEIEQLLSSDDRWHTLPRPYGTFANKELFNTFSAIADEKGVTVTAPGFYAPQGRSVNISPRTPDFLNLLSTAHFKGKAITNIEMETAGIYGLSDLLGHQAVSISAILANRISGEFSEDPEATVEKLIEKALEIIVS